MLGFRVGLFPELLPIDRNHVTIGDDTELVFVQAPVVFGRIGNIQPASETNVEIVH